MFPVPPPGTYQTHNPYDAVPRATPLQGRAVDPHPEKSSTFKGIIQCISKLASTILVVPVVVAVAALNVSRILSHRDGPLGNPYGETASKIRVFALRYLLIAPLGKMLLGDQAELLAGIKAKCEAAVKANPEKQDSIQKAFNNINKFIYASEEERDQIIGSGATKTFVPFENLIPNAIIALRNCGAGDLVYEILPELKELGGITQEQFEKLYIHPSSDAYPTTVEDVFNVYTIFFGEKASDKLFDYLVANPDLHSKVKDADINLLPITDTKKAILKILIKIGQTDELRTVKIETLRLCWNPSRHDGQVFLQDIPKLSPEAHSWINELSLLERPKKDAIAAMRNLNENANDYLLKFAALKYQFSSSLKFSFQKILLGYLLTNQEIPADIQPLINKAFGSDFLDKAKGAIQKINNESFTSFSRDDKLGLTIFMLNPTSNGLNFFFVEKKFEKETAEEYEAKVLKAIDRLPEDQKTGLLSILKELSTETPFPQIFSHYDAVPTEPAKFEPKPGLKTEKSSVKSGASQQKKSIRFAQEPKTFDDFLQKKIFALQLSLAKSSLDSISNLNPATKEKLGEIYKALGTIGDNSGDRAIFLEQHQKISELWQGIQTQDPDLDRLVTDTWDGNLANFLARGDPELRAKLEGILG